MQLPEIYKISIEAGINGFEKTVLDRLLTAFDGIENEAKKLKEQYLIEKSKNFHPDHDDEASIYEQAEAMEGFYVCDERALQQDFLNSSVTWLFHLFEKQKKYIYNTDKTEEIKPLLKMKNSSYDVDSCKFFKVINQEMRALANAVKHGEQSDAMKKLCSNYGNYVQSGKIIVSKRDIEKFIFSLRQFWKKALHDEIVL
ncbi:hypothetical protein ACFXIQ_004298 [Vibrio vulnificus]|uniref:hypothetical protein n=1 Tax=Vibrio vulnificus TaxID=672 RepID=UPI0009B6F5F0|nr:hypothetical protein [Vibrio vulnificus]OQK57607.1 hypothetical protein XM77_c11559 [Vibrio vulnificus]